MARQAAGHSTSKCLVSHDCTSLTRYSPAQVNYMQIELPAIGSKSCRELCQDGSVVRFLGIDPKQWFESTLS